MEGPPVRSVYLVGVPHPVEEALRDALGPGSCRVEAFDQVEAARRRVHQRTPDVVVAEVAVGETDGLDLIRDVRDLDPAITIIALSLKARPARRSQLYLVMAERLGAAYGMTEPLDLAGLIDCVEDAVDGRRKTFE
jgi:DNA-binding NtrC family response regulator